MAPPKDIARSYPKRGLTADVGFRSEPKFCGDGSTEFDGSADYLLANSSFSGAADFSYSAWVNLDSNSGTRTIVGENSDVTIYLYSNKIGVWNLWGTLGAGEYAEKQATNNALTNTWVHIGVSYTYSSNTLKLYIDGVDQPTVPSPVVGPGSTSGKIEIGARDNGGSPLQFLDGKVAGVKRFDVALTQDQIRELYNNPGLIVPTGVSSSNLKRYYKLETDFNDSGADSENLTSVGSPSFTVNRPQLPRGLDLARGAAMARVYTGRALDQDGSVDRLQGANFTDATATACTVSFWMYQRDGGPGRIIHNFGGGATAVDRFIAVMYAGDLYIAGEITSGNRLGFVINNLPLNQWHHVVFVLDGNGTTSLNTTIFYLNGEKYDSPGAVGVIWDATTFDIGGTSHGYQNQLIAGVKVFNTKLTDAQARELYHNPEQVLPTGVSASNLRRYYPLSDYNDTGGTGGRYFQDMGADGEPLEDIGSCSMAFAQPVPCPQLGLQQSATRAHFPGTTVTGSATIPALGTAASLSCWFFWDNSSRTSYPIAVGTVNSTTDGLNIRIDTSGNVTTYESTDFDSGLNVTEGTWNHIVIVSQTASPYWKCFVNNVEATSPAAKSAAINITSTNAHVGTNGNNFGAAGIVADAAIWSSELSDANVAALYNSGVMGADVSQVDSSNLVAWWKCDDLTSCKDFSGNGRAMSYSTTLNAASFPENANGSTIVGDFSMKRKGVSVLNPTATPLVTGVTPGAQIANDGSLNIDPANGGHTVSFFIRVEMGSASGGMMLAPAAGTVAANWHFCYFTSTINAVPPRLQIGDGTTTYRNYIWPAAITNPEEWHQLAYTVDFSTSPTTFRLYLDGALVSTQAAYTHLAIDSGDVMHVGNNSSGTLNFPGAIACVKMYQAKLSDNEIEQIYRSDLRLIKGLNNE